MDNDLILYSTADGKTKISLRETDGTVWLTQSQMAELFDCKKQNISLHIKKIFDEGELKQNSVVKHYLTTAADGKEYSTLFYSLDMILAVGMRVRSVRGTQFRQWAIEHLKEYLVKGFVLDDDRLKGSVRSDYFDELLRRIRDIRASELRFYQKVRDLFALAVDYKGKEEETAEFFAIVQNKLLYAVAQKTAAELIVARADPSQPNMNLTSWSGSVVRKTDIYVAKNYLTNTEIDGLNRLVTLFLDFAEMRAGNRQTITLNDWKEYVDRFVAFNERPLLKTAGSVSHERMKEIVSEKYAEFDAIRKEQNRLAAEEQDAKEIAELEAVEKRLEKK